MAPKRITIVEPVSSGHHMALYVRYAVRALVSEGWEISILTTETAVSSLAFEIVERELPDTAKIFLMPPPVIKTSAGKFSNIRSQFLDWWALRKSFLKVNEDWQPDIVYIPTTDWIAKAIEILGSPFAMTPFVALYLSPKHHLGKAGLGRPPRSAWLYRQMFGRLLHTKTLKRLLVIDEYFYDVAARLHPDKLCPGLCGD